MFKKFKKPSKPSIKGNPLLIVSILLVIISGLGLYFAFNSVMEPVSVVVPNKDINALQKITESDVTVKKIAKRDLHPLAYGTTDHVIGRYPRMPLTKDEPILKNKLLNNSDELIETFDTLKPNEVVIAMESKDVRIPSILKKGDLVTVMAVTEEGVQELGVGSKYISANGSSLVADIGSVSTTGTPVEGELLLICDRDEGKKILQQSLIAKIVYIVPEHPDYIMKHNKTQE